MNRPIDPLVLAKINVAEATYDIYLTSPDHDYIQKKIVETCLPYELVLLEDMKNRLSDQSVVLDVGANIGNHTFYLANVVGCTVIAFEANTELVEAMTATATEFVKEGKVQVHNFALGAQEGVASFKEILPNNLGAQSLQLGIGTIPVRRLDSLTEISKVDAIKIDVEGMELAVLEGGRKLIETNKPILYVECMSLDRFREVSNFLAELGYVYLETFNATPTHLFLQQANANDLDLQLRIRTVESNYIERENIDLDQQLNECRSNYREMTQVNSSLRSELQAVKQELRATEDTRRLTKTKLKELERAYQVLSETHASLVQTCDSSDGTVLSNHDDSYVAQSYLSEFSKSTPLAWAHLTSEAQQSENEVSETQRKFDLLNNELAEKNAKAAELELKIENYQRRIAVLETKHVRTLREAKEIFLKEKEENLRFMREVLNKRQSALSHINAYQSQLSKISEYKDNIAKLYAGRTDSISDQLHVDVRLKQLEEKHQNLNDFRRQLTVFNKLRAPSRSSEETSAGKRPVKLAAIMDDFTYHSYKEECELMQLSLGNYLEELEEFQPELLFIESAWRGKDEEWGNRVAHRSAEVIEIIMWCKKRKIPTMFWNKEDPIHFETFLNVAKLIDHVFTTDIDCISRYKASLGHENVFFLPFACQPAVHNPVEKYARKDAFCFAGAYYVRYPERTKDLETFVKELPAHANFEIFDRNYGKNNPDYMFPDDYKKFIVGTLSFSEIDRAYKGYKYAINLNSIKHSQTMFARRVYELLASNTITVSNYSRGVRLMFGDLVVTTDSGQQALRKLKVIDTDASTSRRFRLLGLRKVLSQHTYKHRFEYILSKAFARPIQDDDPEIKVIGIAENVHEAESLIAAFERQTYKRKSLMVIGDFDSEQVREPSDFSISYCTIEQFCEEMEQTEQLHNWMAFFCARDYYGDNYLLDLVLGTRYSSADIIGKVAYYRGSGAELILQNGEKAYSTQNQFYARSSIFRAHYLIAVLNDRWGQIAEDQVFTTGSGLAIDEFNYASEAQGLPADALKTVRDLEALHPGWSLASLTEVAEAMEPSVSEILADGGAIMGSEFSQLFGMPSQQIKFSTDGSVWLVTSNLPDGKHEYCYAKRELTLEESGLDRSPKFHLETTAGLNVQIVIVYLNQKKEKISHEIKYANKNVTLTIPEQAKFIRYGMRFYASGSCQIERMIIGQKQLNPGSVFSSAQHLVVTNHYPSYSDLYKNGFVHSRVKAYEEQGVHIDVFRLRMEEAISYHEFDGVDVITGSAEALDKALASGRYLSVLIHFLDANMWNVLKKHLERVRIIVWAHGSEIQPWWRRKYLYPTATQLDEAKNLSANRVAFWDEVLSTKHDNLKFVFVSRSFAREVAQDYGLELNTLNYEIVHNYISEKAFPYTKKNPDLRRKILSIRPYASTTYANDLTVKAILELSKRDFFMRLEFCLVGDGVLFQKLTDPLKEFPNVTLRQAFLTHSEIAEYHQRYGVFLTPSRMDTQGVSRDEAMSSGLVPITTKVGAIPEFVDDTCGRVVDPEDYVGLANAIEEIYRNPSLYKRLSKAAVARVRQQSGYQVTVGKELTLFH